MKSSIHVLTSANNFQRIKEKELENEAKVKEKEERARKREQKRKGYSRFSEEELVIFCTRYENGYDISTDDRYNQWIAIYHPRCGDTPKGKILHTIICLLLGLLVSSSEHFLMLH